MFASIDAFLIAHPVWRGALYVVTLIAIGTLYNWVTFKRTTEEWDAYAATYPKRAAFIRFMRAVFPHLRKIPALAPFIPADEPPKSDKVTTNTKGGAA
jgi:hypothetical protein